MTEKKEDTKCDYGYKNPNRGSSKLTWILILVALIAGLCLWGLIYGFLYPIGEPLFNMLTVETWASPIFLVPFIGLISSGIIIVMLVMINSRLCKRKVEAS